MLWHCWFGDRKGKPAEIIFEGEETGVPTCSLTPAKEAC